MHPYIENIKLELNINPVFFNHFNEKKRQRKTSLYKYENKEKKMRCDVKTPTKNRK